MKQIWFPKMVGVAIISLTIAYVFILTIGRVFDNFKRNDRNYSKFLQTHDNGKWNKAMDAGVAGKKGQSLVNHLFGPTKCQEIFSTHSPTPYEPTLNNIKSVRS